MASQIFVKNLGRHLYVRGTKAECERMARELANTQGLRSWSIAALNERKDVWGLYI
ncbi:MAG: hypothetical protein KJ558_10130 [Gammaproteobacteria bacterium]|nr:hypothetical protein [Gammaproteobacteria bacterium]MBU1655164.1 hypothetical protein [Gammaproteobacteria bacterium]MBU1959975.1 hypothetical protein [Gammaproteobacteria bacterium]